MGNAGTGLGESSNDLAPGSLDVVIPSDCDQSRPLTCTFAATAKIVCSAFAHISSQDMRRADAVERPLSIAAAAANCRDAAGAIRRSSARLSPTSLASGNRPTDNERREGFAAHLVGGCCPHRQR